jgi:hypothetical protein
MQMLQKKCYNKRLDTTQLASVDFSFSGKTFDGRWLISVVLTACFEP